MDMNNPVEFLKSRWLGGRGTKVLYLAILITIAGVLLMGQSMSGSQAVTTENEKAVQLATEVSKSCGDEEFRRMHGQMCARAAQVLGDGGSSSKGQVLVDAAGAGK